MITTLTTIMLVSSLNIIFKTLIMYKEIGESFICIEVYVDVYKILGSGNKKAIKPKTTLSYNNLKQVRFFYHKLEQAFLSMALNSLHLKYLLLLMEI